MLPSPFAFARLGRTRLGEIPRRSERGRSGRPRIPASKEQIDRLGRHSPTSLLPPPQSRRRLSRVRSKSERRRRRRRRRRGQRYWSENGVGLDWGEWCSEHVLVLVQSCSATCACNMGHAGRNFLLQLTAVQAHGWVVSAGTFPSPLQIIHGSI